MVATEKKRLTITVRRWIKSGELVATRVVSLKRLKNKAARVIPAKHVPAKAGSRNPEGRYGRFRVKHGMTYCMVIARTLH